MNDHALWLQTSDRPTMHITIIMGLSHDVIMTQTLFDNGHMTYNNVFNIVASPSSVEPCTRRAVGVARSDQSAGHVKP